MTQERKTELRAMFETLIKETGVDLFIEEYLIPDIEEWVDKSFPVDKPVKPEIAELKKMLNEVFEMLLEAPELNMGNYDENQVRELNYAVIITLEEKIKTKQMYAEILTEKNTVLSGITLVKQVGMVLFVDDVLEILKEAQQVSVEPVVKPACETLQKRFEIYMDAINRIDDFFEYRYEHLEKQQIKTVVMAIIDGITDQLSKSV